MWNSALLLLLLCPALVAGQSLTGGRKTEAPLRIESFPPGVDVYLNGRHFGKTPLVLYDLEPGSYEIEMRGPHIKTWKLDSIVYSPSTGESICPVLDGNYGVLRLFCPETRAHVFIDDSLVGTTPLPELKIRAGLHSLKVEKNGYDTYRKPIYVERVRSRMVVRLTSAYGTFSMGDTSHGTSILIDGRQIKRSEMQQLKLPTGEHDISYECYSDGLRSNERFNIEPDRECVGTVIHNKFTFRPFLYSLLIPGLGQFLDNDRLGGAEFFSGALLSGMVFYACQSNYDSQSKNYTARRNEYLTANNEYEADYYRGLMQKAATDARNAQTYRNISLGVFMGVYTFNLVNALLFHSRTDYIKFIQMNENFPRAGAAEVRVNLRIPFSTSK